MLEEVWARISLFRKNSARVRAYVESMDSRFIIATIGTLFLFLGPAIIFFSLLLADKNPA